MDFDLVFEGGGAKGIVFVDAVQELESFRSWLASKLDSGPALESAGTQGEATRRATRYLRDGVATSHEDFPGIL